MQPRASTARRAGAFWRLIVLLCFFGIGLSASAAPPAQAPATAKPAAAKPASSKPPAAAPQPGAKPAAANKANSAGAVKGKPAIDTSRRESEIYGERIDGLQKDVEDLKDRIFRSKARLSVLRDTVLHGVMAGSRVIVSHRNVMSSQFRLVKLAVILDGAQIYARTDDSGALDQEDEVAVFDGNLVPGPHELTIELTYRGQGYGLFSYLNGYTFESRSSHSFTAPENGALRVLSVGHERGNLTTEMKNRPSIDWQEIPLDASGKPLPKTGKSKRKKSK